MRQNMGVPPAVAGHSRAEPEEVSVVPTSVPNARRVQLRRTKGWRMPPNTVSVARPTRFGNPFTVGCNPSEFSADLPSYCETVDEAVRHYRSYVEDWQYITEGRWAASLRGKNLACWCPLDAPCHADALLELANAASGIEAPSGGETVKHGSTEGESPTAAGGDARTPSGHPNTSTQGVNRHG